jgi:hypothetical protein
MKNKEEIKQLAANFYPFITTDLICSPKLVRDGYIDGYTQCQEDMAVKKYTEEDIIKAIDDLGFIYDNVKEAIINSLNKQD